MNFRRRQLTGWGILLAAALLGGAWLAHLDLAAKISTDVLDLIPTDEREPELTLVRQLASEAEARTVFIVLTGAAGAPVPVEVARHFADALAREPAFDQARSLGDPAFRDALGQAVFEQRFPLLFPRWLAERTAAFAATGGAPAGLPGALADDVAAGLGRFLATPEAVAFQDVVPADPLLLLPRAVDDLKDGFSLNPPALDGEKSPALVWARLAASPLTEAGQAPAFAALARVAVAGRAEFPGLGVEYTGVNRFAAASRARIEREVTWLNVLSLLAVLAVAFTFIRGVHRALHLVPVVLLSVLGAWVGATLAFDRLHVLVFAVGSLLTGVAIDYGFYLYMQPPAGPEEDYWDKVRRLAKPLLASCLTTAAGFALLMFSALPFIRQLGVFVGAGLLCALAAAVIYFSTVRRAFLEARAFRGGQAVPAVFRRRVRGLLIVLWVAALPGLARLHWRDDIRDLDIPSVELNREDARIRGMFGEESGRTVYLSYGRNIAEAREALEKFQAWLLSAGGGQARAAGLGLMIPTAEEFARAARFVRAQPDFTAQVRAALVRAGFDADGFAPFERDFGRYAATVQEDGLGAAVGDLQARLAGPAGLLLHSGRPLSWLVTLVAGAPAAAAPPEVHTVNASQLQTLNRIFARYRESALWLSLVGLAIVGAGVLLSYGWRDGARIFAIPCGACLGLFGLFGWLGLPLNLFHLLGAFLGVCLTHNYSIFSATSAYRHEPPPVSVRLSALTAAASFGVLALSSIPVVHALGVTVALMVIVALAVIEFEHLAPLGGGA